MRASAEAHLRRIGRRMETAGRYVALYGTVLVLASIGGLKFTAYEAEGLRPLIETSPLLSWAYSVFSLQAFSNLLGVVELATALLLALAPIAPRLGVVGGALATATVAVTSTLLVTGPSWEASLGGFPALSPFGPSSSRTWCCWALRSRCWAARWAEPPRGSRRARSHRWSGRSAAAPPPPQRATPCRRRDRGRALRRVVLAKRRL